MRALVLGVSGLTGRAIAAELSGAGWDVAGTGRDQHRFPDGLRDRDVRFVRSDRYDPAALHQVFAGGADVVVDCLCYTAEHARQLLDQQGSFGSAVVLSSKAVYVDDHGRHSNSDQAPVFAGPVSEQQRLLEPDYSGAFQSREGYAANKVAAELMLQESDAAVSILRPSRVHGAGDARPRAWFVVRRLLDGRDRIAVAHRGATGNHPTAAANLARLVTTCAQRPGARVLNAADPDTPTAAEVVRATAAACDRSIEVVGLDDQAPPRFGWTPWATWPPFFLDTTAASELGYEPIGTYADTVPAAARELLALGPRDHTRLQREDYLTGWFDYTVDDEALTYHDEAAG